MKRAHVVGYELWVTDHLAEWDAIAGNSPWEKARIDSIMTTMHPGDIFYEVGAEHGWMAGIFATRVGPQNMVLIEPSPELWPNIYGTWEANQYERPLATLEAFVGRATSKRVDTTPWPASVVGPECPDLAYRSLTHHAGEIPTVAIDDIIPWIGPAPKGISIDVEGAELGVLQGMTKTLKYDKPHVWLSVHPDLMLRDFRTQPEDIQMLFGAVGYKYEVLGIDHEEHWYATPESWD